MHLPNTPKTFFEVVGLSIHYHFSAIRRMVPLIILLVIVKDAYVYLGGMPSNPYALSLVGIVMGLLIVYILSAILYQVNSLYSGETITWRHALRDVVSRMPKVILALIIFILVPTVLFILAKWVGTLLQTPNEPTSPYAGLILVLAVGIPMMVLYLYYFFTIPNIVTDDMSLGKAFKKSPYYIGNEWRDLVRIFGVYACGLALWVIVSPDTLHGHLMRMYKVSAIFDFIAFSVTLPIMMNLIVLMRNDLTLRKEIE